MNYLTAYYNAPTGLMKITGTADIVSSILFSDNKSVPSGDSTVSIAILECIRQLDEYFEGKRKIFDFPMRQEGTDFQQRVWAELEKIPYGETISYLELSKRIGNEKTIRACGAANGKNQLSIAIPCHRVIGSNGKLIGYSGGLERKKELLLHEARYTLAKGTLFTNTKYYSHGT
jgi:methylated-DNA-[protein]-cysteine S-methyltransferase